MLLRQAFSNLCRNALEACTEAARRAAHRARRHDRPRAARRAHRRHRQRAGHRPRRSTSRIFRPFFTTNARGTGLGLALVQKIIVTHNGRVTAHAEAGGGTRFVVSLPLDDGATG